MQPAALVKSAGVFRQCAWVITPEASEEAQNPGFLFFPNLSIKPA